MAALLLTPFMRFRGVNVVRLLLINLECVGGLQFNKQYKHYLQKGKRHIQPERYAKCVLKFVQKMCKK